MLTAEDGRAFAARQRLDEARSRVTRVVDLLENLESEARDTAVRGHLYLAILELKHILDFTLPTGDK